MAATDSIPKPSLVPGNPEYSLRSFIRCDLSGAIELTEFFLFGPVCQASLSRLKPIQSRDLAVS